MKYIEEHKKTPITDKCEVLVAGGGIAGISAALSAARHGKDTLLIENEFALGGLATLGIVTIYLPLCDGKGHQVIYGIGEELLKLSYKYGAECRTPTMWITPHSVEERATQRYEVQYNPNIFMLEVEKLLLDAGVRILYGSRICGTTVDKDTITSVIIENKSGRSAVEVESVIDCTGDADIAAFSGAKTEKFAQGNVLAGWYYSLSGGVKKLNMLGFADIPDSEKGSEEKVEKLVSRRFAGLDGKELSEQMQFSHASTLRDFKKKRETNEDTEISMIATIPQIRMTRRIVGDIDLDTSDDKRRFEDSIGMTGNWKKSGPVYEVPFGAIRSVNIRNLLAAGRCISTTDAMWDVTRVIPTCAVTGEAAGVAASVTCDFRSADIGKIQSLLREAGVKLHTDEVLS